MTRGWLGCLGSGFHGNVFFVKATVVGGWMIFVGHPETGATLSFPRFFSKTSGILPASLRIPFDPKNGGHQQTLKRLGSGNSNISMFIPMWGNDPIWWAKFSDGLVEPPTRRTWSKRGHDFKNKNLKTLATNVRPYDRYKWNCNPHTWLGGGFKDFLFLPLVGEDFQFDEHIFQNGLVQPPTRWTYKWVTGAIPLVGTHLVPPARGKGWVSKMDADTREGNTDEECCDRTAEGFQNGVFFGFYHCKVPGIQSPNVRGWLRCAIFFRNER